MKLGKISEAEMEIMKIIWKKNEQVTTGGILEELPKDNSWKVGKLNHYSAKITEDEYKAIQADNFLEDMHNGSVKNFIATLFNNKKISKNDIAELKKWLKEV